MPVTPLAPYMELPECIAALLLLLSLLQGMIRRLANLRGLAWLPLLSLLILISIFPAYGFRLEAVPLLLYSMAYTVIRAVLMMSRPGGFFDDETADRGLFINAASLLLLGGALVLALFFAPLERDTIPSRQLTVRNDAKGIAYTLKIYGNDNEAEAAKKPVILVLPPDLGGDAAVERVCGALAGRGFVVVSAFRSEVWHSPAWYFAYWRLGRRGTGLWKANQFGRALETQRREDLAFLLPRLIQNSEKSGPIAGPGADLDMVYIAGWNAAGSAAVYYAAEAGGVSGLRGIIAVESLFYSAWTEESRQEAEPPEGASALLRFRVEMRNRLSRLRAARTAGVGGVPVPAVPVFYLADSQADSHAGDRAAEDSRRWEALKAAAKNGAVLAAAQGAGPLDYSGIPVDKPLYSALLRGRGKRLWPARDCPANTAALIAAFAANPAAPALKSAAPGVEIIAATAGRP